MSDYDIARIADALEKLAAAKQKDNPWEVIADIHEGYSVELGKILDSDSNTFETARALRSMQVRAMSTANEIRTRLA